MSAQNSQTKANHARIDPSFHGFIIPVCLALLIWATISLVRHRDNASGLLTGLAFMLLVLALKARMYSLKVQDRLIRLEERLRLSALVDASYVDRIADLTPKQLIALRFAPDAEAPALVARAINEGLDAKAIKAAIQQWRGDYFRV
jgi:hypothetical protein